MTGAYEVTPSQKSLRDLVRAARRHWRLGQKAALKFAVELRKLQAGGAHLHYGYDNFGVFAQHTFEDLTASTARHLAWMGATLLTLEAAKRLSLGDWPLPVGSTAVRELASIAAKWGDNAMLETYDLARYSKAGGRPVSGRDVKAALSALLPPASPAQAIPSGEKEPYEPDDEETVGAGAVSEALRSMIGEVDELLHAPWEELDADECEDALRESQALRSHLDRLARRIDETGPPSP